MGVTASMTESSVLCVVHCAVSRRDPPNALPISREFASHEIYSPRKSVQIGGGETCETGHDPIR